MTWQTRFSVYDICGRGAEENVIEPDHIMSDGLHFVTITGGNTARTERLVIR